MAPLSCLEEIESVLRTPLKEVQQPESSQKKPRRKKRGFFMGFYDEDGKCRYLERAR